MKEVAEDLELTILMPCLNEGNSVGFCVAQARRYLELKGIFGEVLVVDNGSIDSSYERASKAGARVITCRDKGYGNALRYGIKHARGKYIVMGDCDGSYDFSRLDDILIELRDGCDLVVGNRLDGIQQGAMPFLHRYVGVPFLSWLGRLCYKTDITDFHCGLRGVNRANFSKLRFKSTGMEFASEMIGKAVKGGLSICEVPIVLYPDQRGKKSHLRPFRDGLRHIKVILKS